MVESRNTEGRSADPSFDGTPYTPEHRRELEQLLKTPGWQEIIRSGFIDQVRAEKILPGESRDFINTVVDQLLEWNGTRVRESIAQGNVDREHLFCELARWPVLLLHASSRLFRRHCSPTKPTHGWIV